MQRITKLYLTDIVIIICNIVIYCTLYDKIHHYYGVFIIGSIAVCLLARSIIFGSISSGYISLVFMVICAIICLNITQVITAKYLLAYLMVALSGVTLLYGLIFKIRALQYVGLFGVIQGVIYVLYKYNYYRSLWMWILTVLTLIIQIALAILYRSKLHGKI